MPVDKVSGTTDRGPTGWPSRVAAALPVFAVLVVAGCGESATPGTARWKDSSWQEVLSIGELAGDSLYQFGRIADVGVTSTGRVVVLDEQARRLLEYRPDGRYARTIAGPGSGPGELGTGVGRVLIGRADTILVPDPLNRRMLVAAAGRQVTTAPLFADAAFPVGFQLSPERVLFVQWRRITVEGVPGAGIAGARDVVVRHGYDGTALDTVLTLPLETAILKEKGTTTDVLLFEREALWTFLGAGLIAVGVNDTHRIELHDRAGRAREEIVLPGKPTAITEADRRTIRSIVRRQTEAKGGPSSAADDYLERVDFGDHLPAFTRFLAGPDGSLWVRRPRAPRDLEPDDVRLASSIADLVDSSPLWDVFSGDGEFLGLVELPDRFTPLRFAGDTLYGAFRDEFDVEYVRGYVFAGEGLADVPLTRR